MPVCVFINELSKLSLKTIFLSKSCIKIIEYNFKTHLLSNAYIADYMANILHKKYINLDFKYIILIQCAYYTKIYCIVFIAQLCNIHFL